VGRRTVIEGPIVQNTKVETTTRHYGIVIISARDRIEKMKREEEQRNRDRELQQQQQQQSRESQPEKVKEVKVVREEQRVAVEKPLIAESRREDKKEAEVEVVVVK
jgi:hypothetical protein